MADVGLSTVHRPKVRPVRAVIAARLRAVAGGLVSGVRDWLGLDLAVVGYVVVASATFEFGEAQLLGALTAMLVAATWYVSPAARWEAARRNRPGRKGDEGAR